MRVMVVVVLSALLLASAPTAQAEAFPGPDGEGYGGIDSDMGLPVVYESIVGKPGTQLLKSGYGWYPSLNWNYWASATQDYTFTPLDFPMKFTYYGKTYTEQDTWSVHENGVFSFHATPSGWAGNDAMAPPSSSQQMPVSKAPNSIIAPAWTDYVTTVSWNWACYYPPSPYNSVYWRVDGVEPERVLTVQWNQMSDGTGNGVGGNCGNTSTFQLLLEERCNAVEFRYGAMGVSKFTVAGVQKDANTGLSYYAGPGSALEGKRVRIAQNDCPTAVDDKLTIYEDARTPALLLLNDLDTNGDTLRIVYAGSVGGEEGVTDRGGKIELVPSKVFGFYTPPEDQNSATLGGPDTFVYTIEDSVGHRASAKVTVNIIGRNDPPRLKMGPAIQVVEDGPFETVANWGSDFRPGPDDEMGQTIEYVRAEAADPTMFRVQPTIDPTGTIRFHTAPDRCTDGPGTNLGTAIHILMKDNGGTANGGREVTPKGMFDAKVVVACDADNPTAVDDTFTDAPEPFVSGAGGVSGPVDVLLNDLDPDLDSPMGDELTVLEVEPATAGTVTIDPTGSVVQFSAPKGFSGPASFRYRAQDASGRPSDWARVDVRVVCETLILTPNTFTLEEGKVLRRDAASILADDDLPEGHELQVSVYEQPEKGTVTMAPDGAFVYTPEPDAAGTDHFRYRVRDVTSGCQDVVPVLILFEDENDAPTATNDHLRIKEDAQDVELKVLDNDSALPDLNEAHPKVVSVVQGRNGAARVFDGRLFFTPLPDFFGTETLQYTIADPKGAKATATVTIEVEPVPDAPRAIPDSYSVRPGGRLAPGERTVLGNDFDPDGGLIMAELLTQPRHASVAMMHDGTFNLVAARDYLGQDSFTYIVRDEDGLRSLPATVMLTIGDNQPPVAAFRTPGGQVAVNVPVTFTSQSRDPDGFLMGHQWDFGDGHSSGLASPRHAYERPGQYTVRLTVVDNDGRLASATAQVEVVSGYTVDHGGVLGAAAPTVDAGEDRSVLERSHVVLAATSSAVPVTVTWRQVEGPPVALVDAQSLQPQFNAPAVPDPAKPARLTFEVTVFDGLRTSDPDQVTVTVHNPTRPPTEPRLDAGLDQEVLAGERVKLSASLSNTYPEDQPSFRWEQVEGPTVGPIVNGPTTYVSAPASPGERLVFRATATVRGMDLTDEVIVHVVDDVTREGFTFERGRGRAAHAVSFTPLLPGRAVWDFGDGATSDQREPTHTYAESGTYLATLTITGADGPTRTYTKEVRVHVEQPATAAAVRDAPAPAIAFGMLALAALALAISRRR